MADYAPPTPNAEASPVAPRLFLPTRAAEKWERTNNPHPAETPEATAWSMEFWGDQARRWDRAFNYFFGVYLVAGLVFLAVVTR